FFFFQAEDGIRDFHVTGVQTCALPIFIDDFSRECLATVVDNSISGERVARELDRIAERRGFPCMIVSDNGTELISNAMVKWQQEIGRASCREREELRGGGVDEKDTVST